MAQLVVRNLEEKIKIGLRRRANRNGRSMEEEVRSIVRKALRTEPENRVLLGSRLRKRFAGIGLEHEIPSLRGQKARAADFGSRIKR